MQPAERQQLIAEELKKNISQPNGQEYSQLN